MSHENNGAAGSREPNDATDDTPGEARDPREPDDAGGILDGDGPDPDLAEN